MGTYVNPPSLAEQKGRRIKLKSTLAETLAQLGEGEKLCALSRGQVTSAIVITTDRDFQAVKASAPQRLIGLFAIGPDVLAYAR